MKFIVYLFDAWLNFLSLFAGDSLSASLIVSGIGFITFAAVLITIVLTILKFIFKYLKLKDNYISKVIVILVLLLLIFYWNYLTW